MSSTYKPKNLINVSENKHHKVYMDKTAGCMLLKLIQQAKIDGITIFPVSAFRSYNYQKNVFNRSAMKNGIKDAQRYVALPGQSEHQTGLAVDLGTVHSDDLSVNFDKTKAYKWLECYMHNFGFILRYPKDKENITKYSYEPWHIRYVGIDVAKIIHTKNITLEEYIEHYD